MGVTATTLDTTSTAGRGYIEFEGGRNALLVYVTFVMSASYATGGDTLTLPSDVTGRELKAVIILNPLDGTRMYQWNGDTAAPKIMAFTGLGTEVANTTDLDAVAAREALLLYTG
jgi:hypothetical protein